MMVLNSKINYKTVSPEKLIGGLNEIEAKFSPGELYIIGDSELMDTTRVAIIGTRHPSEEAILNARMLTNFLIRNKVTIVSGLALGIDTIAHETAINGGGRTISVIGAPLDVYYPRQNKELQDKIIKNHLLISQFEFGCPIQRKNFPQRNRTMALLSNASIIVEAKEGSGTIHQGWEALRLGRPLYILESNDLKWAEKLIEYGAKIISIKDSIEILDSLPEQISMVVNNAPF